MNKRGIALIFSFMVMVVLFILIDYFFLKVINENNLVKRHLCSMQAFWVAEAGIAQAIANLPSSPNDGTLGGNQYQSTTAYRTTINSSDYYDVVSTGTVSLPGGGGVTRTIDAIVKRGTVDPSKFKYAIDAANDLCFGGNCQKPPDNYLNPTVCPGGNCWKQFDSTINFSDLFGYSQSAIQSIATRYTDSNFPGTVSGVTWVDVAPGNTLMATSSVTGSGVLIVNGNVQFGGSYQFHGIIYVLGTLTARGTFDGYGSSIVASSVGVDSINGTPTFHFNIDDITSALQQIANNFASVVSWKEG